VAAKSGQHKKRINSLRAKHAPQRVESPVKDKRRVIKRKESKKKELRLGEVFHLLVTAGHSYHDICHTYTIQQVWLFYEVELKRQLDAKRDIAIIVAQGVSAGTPADTREGANAKERSWKQFLESLDWDSVTKPQQKVNPLKAFGALAQIAKKE
jgi:hypothetical protein